MFEFKIIEIIDNPTREKLLEREQFYLDSIKPEYNTSKKAGSLLGVTLSIEHKKKIGESNKGKKHTDEFKQSVSTRHKGKTLSIETRKKISDKLKGQNKGKKHTDEFKLNLKKIRTGKKHTDETKAKIALAHKNRNSIRKEG